MKRHSYESIGTQFTITVWSDISDTDFFECMQVCEQVSRDFDNLYSRFKPDSLIQELSRSVGVTCVPNDLVCMLRIYQDLYEVTGGKINPLVGHTLEDIGYDAAYSLKEQPHIRTSPNFLEALHIEDETHIRVDIPSLIDVGALGKGYLIDILYGFLASRGLRSYLIDGSGDIRYSGGEPITCGLEHPIDPTLAIGTHTLYTGALCASATNRRRWGARHHYVDPDSGKSVEEIVGTWVAAPEAALADGLSSALFFTAPEILIERFSFEYLVIDKDLVAQRSAQFPTELFT